MRRARPKTVCETERLRLRHATAEDAPFVLAMMNDPSFLRFIGDRGVRTVDDARAYIAEKFTASYAEHGFGMYVTVLKETGAAVGSCGLARRDGLDDVDIGFAFLSAYRDRGYAHEAARAVMAHARDDIGLSRIVAITDPTNARSAHLLEKLGLAFERMIRLPDDDTDLRLYVRAL
ncbi:MAG: GNAT family N-acetyltransferase [Sphingomonadales bacterium]|nr:GNAT family N-acetyltransferase [Sphingomonadales bacterium]